MNNEPFDSIPSLEREDEREHWRCPSLGGPVPFRYCRTTLNGLPCRRVVECWHTLFDVADFLQRHYEESVLKDAWEKPTPPKMVTLAEIIERARRKKAQRENPSEEG